LSFTNKKERVVQIELTQFGKKLLSTGGFHPEFYQFFDDDIIYDNNYAGATDGTGKAQDRIKESVRLPPQYVNLGLQTRFEKETEDIEAGLRDLFEELGTNENQIESEKLLSFPLGDMNLETRDHPMFNLRAYDSLITSTAVQYLTQSGQVAKIPQVSFKSEHTLEINTLHQTSDPGTLHDSETYTLDFTENKVEFLDGSFLLQDTEGVVVSLDESNVKYTKENFEVEIYEVLEDKELVRIKDMEQILKYFDIQTDASVAEVPKRKRINKNFFQTKE
jgi:hypothetical protein